MDFAIRLPTVRVAARHFIIWVSVLTWAGAAGATQSGGHPADMTPQGPKQDAAIYWVGHSLVEGKAQSEWGEIDLMSLVARFARDRGLGYRGGDHTLWGSSMAALWRGAPHSFKRDASEMVAKREEFVRNAGQFDTLVVTESLPVAWAAKNEFSAYYLRRFACPLVEANPDARVFLYQTWVNLQGQDGNAHNPPPYNFDWRSEMGAQRKVWEAIADEASEPRVRVPGGWLSKLGWASTGDGGCDAAFPVFIIPVGQALVALADRLAHPQTGDTFTWAHGGRLAMEDLFANPYADWPAAWPLEGNASDTDADATFKSLTLRDPDRPLDDIHPSAHGLYFAALVHFATIYRQSPAGLPAPAAFGEDLARTLQCIVWDTVVADARSGVIQPADKVEGACDRGL